jgi:excinuclease ABC subunit B
VGINLLREGLDLPEVSLVAVLDADKEGFLRSSVSLIQTIGRAARHVEGRVILYADTVTVSMQRAIQETDRRRAKQRAYNEANGITPRSIQKKVGESLHGPAANDYPDVSYAAEQLQAYGSEDLVALTAKLRDEMIAAAEGLNFEEAAQLRDRIQRIKGLELGIPREPGAPPPSTGGRVAKGGGSWGKQRSGGVRRR